MENTDRSATCSECGGTGRKEISPSQWVQCDACNVAPPPEDKSKSGNRWLLTLLAIVVIGTFLWRTFAAGHEYPSAGYRNMTIGLDLLCLVSLIGLRLQASRWQPPITFGLNMLFWFALVAGLGIFAIRLDGRPESWATGHLNYELLPRSNVHVNPATAATNSVANNANAGAVASTPAAPGSPTASYQAFYAATKNKDIKTMKSLVAKDAFAQIYSSTHDRKEADAVIDKALTTAAEAPQAPSDATRNEIITGNTATIECLTIKGAWYTQKFVKEDGVWKVKL